MQPAPAQSGVEEALPPLLADLARVLEDEARALKALDRDGIDRAADQKTKIHAALAASPPSMTAGQKGPLERLRQQALRNHMLLTHARDSVRQVLTTVSGRPSSPVLGGLRLDVRG